MPLGRNSHWRVCGAVGALTLCKAPPLTSVDWLISMGRLSPSSWANVSTFCTGRLTHWFIEGPSGRETCSWHQSTSHVLQNIHIALQDVLGAREVRFNGWVDTVSLTSAISPCMIMWHVQYRACARCDVYRRGAVGPIRAWNNANVHSLSFTIKQALRLLKIIIWTK